MVLLLQAAVAVTEKECDLEKLAKYEEEVKKLQPKKDACYKLAEEKKYKTDDKPDLESEWCAIRECHSYFKNENMITPDCGDLKKNSDTIYKECKVVFDAATPTNTGTAASVSSILIIPVLMMTVQLYF